MMCVSQKVRYTDSKLLQIRISNLRKKDRLKGKSVVQNRLI